MKMRSSLLRPAAALAAALVLLAGCGGGGDDGPPGVPPGGSARYAEDPGDPLSCTVARQKNFVRAYLDEVYLWYDEIRNVDPGPYTTVGQVDDYFDALMVRSKDPWSTAIFTGKAASRLQSVAGGSQASLGGLIATHAVPAAPSVTTTSGGRRVAYLQLRNHDQGAQNELIAAFQQIDTQNVDDLILDLRDNVGGFLYVALTAASMITGPVNDGRIFERVVFNDKRGEAAFLFSGVVQYTDAGSTTYREGTPLPRLGLQRVFVLTGGDARTGRVTCSASESIINSLRGIGVDVIRLGEKTCGKPYGFSEKVNCGYSYYAVEFQGFNAQGFGDFQDGFEPMCRIRDQVPFADRGTADDPVFMGALVYADQNSCPPGSTATGVQSAATPAGTEPPLLRPYGAARLLLPEQLPR